MTEREATVNQTPSYLDTPEDEWSEAQLDEFMENFEKLEPCLTDELIGMIDVLPPVLDVVGLPTPAHAAGASLYPLVRGEPEPPRVVFAQWRERGVRALREGPYKLIRIPDDLRLFDLAEDPGERHSIERSRPGVRRHLIQSLHDVMTQAQENAKSALPAPAAPMTAETRERLRALGYLE